MRKINSILIGTLWLLAMALVSCFWFNTQYGFNVFSCQHWQYLAYMQASQQSIKMSFYISLAFIVLITVFGLYFLLQPHRRKIVLPVYDRSIPPASNMPTTLEQPVMQTPIQEQQKNIEIQPETKSEQPSVKMADQTVPTTPLPPRPPRLNIPNVPRSPLPTVPLNTNTTIGHDNTQQDYSEIQNIFESAGYIVKGSPRVKGVQTSVIAIGNDEVLWIGANGISTTDMQRTVDTLSGVFTDTLEDIEIHIHAFIIGATDNDSSSSDIMHFANIEELRKYISSHPNSSDDEDDSENMDAYSAYIGTVVDYIRKI